MQKNRCSKREEYGRIVRHLPSVIECELLTLLQRYCGNDNNNFNVLLYINLIRCTMHSDATKLNSETQNRKI